MRTVGLKHTPGPWRAYQQGEVRAADQTTLAAVYAPLSASLRERVPERLANARLMAAAPELYAALQALLEPDARSLKVAREMAHAAVRKAQGLPPEGDDGA